MPLDPHWPVATPVDEMLERVQRRAAQLHRRRRALLLAAPAVGLTLVASLVGHGTAGPRVRMTPPAGHVHASVSRPPGVAAQTGAGRGPTRPTAVAGPVGDAGTTSTSALSTPEPVRLAATGRVAFVRHGAIWTAKVDGSGLHPVTTPDDHLSAPEWSPDGTRLAAQWTLHDLRRVVVLELDGSYRFVTDPADRAEDGRWSPDGTRLLVFKGFGVGGGGLWTVDVDTGAQRVVSNAGGVKADWSPDGRIVYECPEGLCVMDGDGAHPRPVVAGHYARPRWSPDGTRLLAFRTSGPTQP
ncbi:MAG TPA: hypothetical protein VGO92_15305, partial [Acidimicrobiales bacterium]|nr:hypothetical protein [Acidimicrobiales bacterium]